MYMIVHVRVHVHTLVFMPKQVMFCSSRKPVHGRSGDYFLAISGFNLVLTGTSNWSGDYFLSTGGLGLVVQQNRSADDDVTARSSETLQAQLAAVFERDWNSQYALPVDDVMYEDSMTADSRRRHKQEL